jgi:hypothetical protein
MDAFLIAVVAPDWLQSNICPSNAEPQYIITVHRVVYKFPG